jgi:hypothetical protein
LLRHGHVTFDRRGDQFVVRRQDAAAPPDASRVPLYYLRGGGMMLRASVSTKEDDTVPLFVDSSRPFLLALEDDAWRRAGVDVKSLVALPDLPNVKHGTVPTFRIGALDLPKVPAVEGVDMGELARGLDVSLGGVVGADLLAFFRVTFADDGRFAWLEADPTMFAPTPAAAPLSPAPQSTPLQSPPATSVPPAPSPNAPQSNSAR